MRRLEEVARDHVSDLAAVREEVKEQIEEMQKSCEGIEIRNKELEKELKKLKKHMINIPQGGHGTFSIVFEEVRKYHGITLTLSNSVTEAAPINSMAKKIGALLTAEHSIEATQKSIEEKSHGYGGDGYPA